MARSSSLIKHYHGSLTSSSSIAQSRRWPIRAVHTSQPRSSHENPLGLPPRPSLSSTSTSTPRPPQPSSSAPTIPRRPLPPPLPKKQKIPGVKHVVVVSSGKGGVGKSTVAANLAVALARSHLGSSYLNRRDKVDDAVPSVATSTRKLRIGILDLDVFGPSIPKLFNLESVGAPELTRGNKLIPLRNHGVDTMSVGYLMPASANNDSPIAWRGMMVMKAVQQLLFDVDWRDGSAGRNQGLPSLPPSSSSSTQSQSASGGLPGRMDGRESERDRELDILVVDMPPGTGDVQLSLGQLVVVDGAIIISTPQSVSLIDARKGVNMFRKLHIPIIGAVLNQSHYTCECCGTSKELFGDGKAFEGVVEEMGMDVVGKIPLVPTISTGGDAGLPIMAESEDGSAGDTTKGHGWRETRDAFEGLARKVLRHLGQG